MSASAIADAIATTAPSRPTRNWRSLAARRRPTARRARSTSGDVRDGGEDQRVRRDLERPLGSARRRPPSRAAGRWRPRRAPARGPAARSRSPGSPRCPTPRPGRQRACRRRGPRPGRRRSPGRRPRRRTGLVDVRPRRVLELVERHRPADDRHDVAGLDPCLLVAPRAPRGAEMGRRRSPAIDRRRRPAVRPRPA